MTFDDINRGYLLTDRYLTDKEREYSNYKDKEYWQILQKINEEAYYLILFSFLEGEINRACQVIKKNIKNIKHNNHLIKRACDIIDIERLSFGQRTELVLGKSSHYYRDVMGYYGTRCDIAHGKLDYYDIPVTAFIERIQEIIDIIKSEMNIDR
ncbi:MAG: hypothetical protein L3V56_06570 [Candidatus Magnetoovum sp. WYHC-5]|nr:hypothetical protein [Candidatus Magnetoovum sp. WYHC-5]